MVKLTRERIRTLFTVAIPLLAIISISFILQITIVSHQQQITRWLSSIGPLIILVYVLIQWAAIIIPPIPGGIVRLPILALFGPLKGLALIYLTTTPAECLNFWISKKYGRVIVTKFVGKKSMARVDHYAKDAGLGTLIVLKLFEDSYFDYISYGLGLTSISFKQFTLVNFLVGILQVIMAYIILVKAPNFTSSIVILEVITGILTGSYILFKHWQHQRKLRMST